jgi:hypothetical protein
MRFQPLRLARLVDAMKRAFLVDEMRALLLAHIGDDLQDVTPGGLRPNVFQDVAGYYNRLNTIECLVAALRAERPNDRSFLEFEDEELAEEIPVRDELERRLREEVPYVDPVRWRAAWERAEACVCLITLRSREGRSMQGTGCLIAADRVLTAAHVMAPILDTHNDGIDFERAEVRFHFDYRNVRDDSPPDSGVVYGLHRQEPVVAAGRVADLDFAVMRLDGAAGAEPFGGAARRGWIDLPRERPAYRRDAPLLILQHPLGDAIKLAIETHSIVGLNDAGTRLRHRTNTDGGSSGAPCFDIHWNLIGVHRGALSGQPHNEAVPIWPIVEALA